MLKKWVKEDTDTFNSCDPTVFFMQCQIEDYLDAIENDRDPSVSGEAGRKTVELFSAIYRSSRDNAPVKFPLKHEPGLDGRQKV
jgi:predicted dehydrogenase